jgi:hypothetical protein
MRERNRAVKKSITPPVATDVDDVGDVPGVAPISDDGSVDSSLFSHASESEGDIWGNNNYDDASIAHEGANLVPPDFDGNEGVQLTPNITPAPEGAHRRTRGNAFSMDLQLCSECSVRTYSFGISYQGTV